MSSSSSFWAIDEKGNRYQIFIVPGKRIPTTTIHSSTSTSIEGLPSLQDGQGDPVTKISETEFLIVRSNTKVKKSDP